MKKMTLVVLTTLCLTGLSTHPTSADAQTSTTQDMLNQSAQEQKYTLIVFYKQDDPATQTMARTVQDSVANRSNMANLAFVQMTNPAESAVVERFGVSRAPAPLTVMVAPNGAVTGVFVKTVSDDRIASSFVTPTKAVCMKSLQQGKLVLVCMNTAHPADVPQGVKDFQSDPQFRDRVAVVSMQASDPNEAPFVTEMQLTSTEARIPTTVFLAPPGVLVGKFNANATQDQLAAELHKAGKCCDDPHCKHNKKPSTSR